MRSPCRPSMPYTPGDRGADLRTPARRRGSLRDRTRPSRGSYAAGRAAVGPNPANVSTGKSVATGAESFRVGRRRLYCRPRQSAKGRFRTPLPPPIGPRYTPGAPDSREDPAVPHALRCTLIALLVAPTVASPAEKVAAVVNGEPLTVAELETALAHHPLPTAPLSAIQKRQRRMEALSILIDDKLVRQFLRQHGPKVEPLEVRSEEHTS